MTTTKNNKPVITVALLPMGMNCKPNTVQNAFAQNTKMKTLTFHTFFVHGMERKQKQKTYLVLPRCWNVYLMNLFMIIFSPDHSKHPLQHAARLIIVCVNICKAIDQTWRNTNAHNTCFATPNEPKRCNHISHSEFNEYWRKLILELMSMNSTFMWTYLPIRHWNCTTAAIQCRA